MPEPIVYSGLYLQLPWGVLAVTGMEILERPNCHGEALLQVLLEGEEGRQAVDSLKQDTIVKVLAGGPESQEPLFAGVCCQLKLERVKGIWQGEIRLKSATMLMDIQRTSRSFQAVEKPLREVFAAIEAKYPGADLYDKASEGGLQEHPFIQYRETDWQFIKRIASQVRGVVVPQIKASQPVMRIGHLQGDTYIEKGPHYHMVKELEGFAKAWEEYEGWQMEDKIYYEIESFVPYNLCDKIQYEEIGFIVVYKKTILQDGLLRFQYRLQKKEALAQDLYFNQSIQGGGIEGTVLAVSPDRVKLHLAIDPAQAVAEACWYKMQWAYTAEGATGFYTMPQVGDRAQLYFPTADDREAYVRIIHRQDGKENPKTQQPDVKYYANPQGKEIMLAPGEMQFTAVNGQVLVNLHNSDGIEITGCPGVKFRAGGGSIKGRNVYFRAGGEVLFRTAKGGLLVGKEIHIKADKGSNLP